MNFNTELRILMRLIIDLLHWFLPEKPCTKMAEVITPRTITAESCLKLKIPLSYDNNLFFFRSRNVFTRAVGLKYWFKRIKSSGI